MSEPNEHVCRSGARRVIPKGSCVACMRAERNELLAACKAARSLYDVFSLGPLEAAAKYGPDYELPTDEECLRIREQLETAITKAGDCAR